MKHYYKISLLKNPDADGYKDIFKTINLAYQILTNRAREDLNIFEFHEAESVLNNKN